MSTRALIRVFEGDDEIVDIYRHCDGYPEGLGRELADFCAQRRIVDGISSRYRQNAIANGAGCFAAFLVVHLKKSVGGVYLHAPKSDDKWCDYTYEVRIPSGDDVREAEHQRPDTFDGLPVRVTCYQGKERTLVPIPDDVAVEQDGVS